ncbi:MAG: hypothetical protein JJE40_10990 [Vicinamibacteria bacterium]|nr:hypothetical protein [Vicinamibacteria bacterium]
MRRARLSGVLVLLTVAAAPLVADTLVMRDGRRVSGTLVSVRNDTIEFDQSRGVSGDRRLRLDRRDVARVEFDDGESGGGSGGGGGPQGGMRERTVTVQARQAWTDTGIDVRRGQQVYLNASGEIRWGTGGRKDGPEGENNSPFNQGRPIPSRPAGALIGRVGDNDAPFFAGSDRGPYQMRGSGRLYLGVNDDYLQDNSGTFRVVVSY